MIFISISFEKETLAKKAGPHRSHPATCDGPRPIHGALLKRVRPCGASFISPVTPPHFFRESATAMSKSSCCWQRKLPAAESTPCYASRAHIRRFARAASFFIAGHTTQLRSSKFHNRLIFISISFKKRNAGKENCPLKSHPAICAGGRPSMGGLFF